MKIIDSHTHIGGSRLTDSYYSEEQWLHTMERYHLDGIMVYPITEPLPDVRTMDDRIHQFALDNPGRVFGVIDISPRLDEDEYVAEVTRAVKELGFVAVKYHPSMHGCMPGAHCVDKVFETARTLGIPVIVHTGAGTPNSLPSLLVPRARSFPDVRIVLAHAGAFIYTEEAIEAAEQCENIWLEPSWCSSIQLKSMIKRVGIERLMFGSDGPLNVGVELSKVEAIDMSEHDQELYLGKNAIDFYGLKVK